MRLYLISCGVFLIWMAHRLSYNEAIEFKMTNAVCKSFNESWFVIYKCRLRAISRNITVFNLNASILHPANMIHAKFQLYQRANGYKPWLVSGFVDCCQFVKKPFNPAAIVIFKLFREFSNINHTCPYFGPQIIDGFYLRWKYLPHGMPTGDYLLAFNWSFDRRVQFMVNIYFLFTENLQPNV